jgi:hypothetical protein
MRGQTDRVLSFDATCVATGKDARSAREKQGFVNWYFLEIGSQVVNDLQRFCEDDL